MALHGRRLAAWSFARSWLFLAGVALLVLAVLGLFRLDVGAWDSAGAEHWSHWLTGLALVALAVVVRSDRVLALVSLAAGVVFVFTALLDVLLGNLGALGDAGAADNAMHLAVGLVSMAAGWMSRPAGTLTGRRHPM